MTPEIATTPAPEVQPLTLEDVQAYAPFTMDQLEAQLHDREVLLQNINQLIKERNDFLTDCVKVVFRSHDIFTALGLDEISTKNKLTVVPFIMSKLPEVFEFLSSNPALTVEYESLKFKYSLIVEDRQKQLELEKALGK